MRIQFENHLYRPTIRLLLINRYNYYFKTKEGVRISIANVLVLLVDIYYINYFWIQVETTRSNFFLFLK